MFTTHSPSFAPPDESLTELVEAVGVFTNGRK